MAFLASSFLLIFFLVHQHSPLSAASRNLPFYTHLHRPPLYATHTPAAAPPPPLAANAAASSLPKSTVPLPPSRPTFRSAAPPSWTTRSQSTKHHHRYPFANPPPRLRQQAPAAVPPLLPPPPAFTTPTAYSAPAPSSAAVNSPSPTPSSLQLMPTPTTSLAPAPSLTGIVLNAPPPAPSSSLQQMPTPTPSSTSSLPSPRDTLAPTSSPFFPLPPISTLAPATKTSSAGPSSTSPMSMDNNALAKSPPAPSPILPPPLSALQPTLTSFAPSKQNIPSSPMPTSSSNTHTSLLSPPPPPPISPTSSIIVHVSPTLPPTLISPSSSTFLSTPTSSPLSSPKSSIISPISPSLAPLIPNNQPPSTLPFSDTPISLNSPFLAPHLHVASHQPPFVSPSFSPRISIVNARPSLSPIPSPTSSALELSPTPSSFSKDIHPDLFIAQGPLVDETPNFDPPTLAPLSAQSLSDNASPTQAPLVSHHHKINHFSSPSPTVAPSSFFEKSPTTFTSSAHAPSINQENPEELSVSIPSSISPSSSTPETPNLQTSPIVGGVEGPSSTSIEVQSPAHSPNAHMHFELGPIANLAPHMHKPSTPSLHRESNTRNAFPPSPTSITNFISKPPCHAPQFSTIDAPINDPIMAPVPSINK